MTTRHRRAAHAIAALGIALAAGPAAAQEACSHLIALYEPCTFDAVTDEIGIGRLDVHLNFVNTTGMNLGWFLVATDDPTCQSAPPAHWANFNPGIGMSPNNPQPQQFLVRATFDGRMFAEGVHSAYACFGIGSGPGSRIAIPINLLVPSLLTDGFEEPP